MAQRRDKLTERDLRETKDHILEAMADHQRAVGQDADSLANAAFLDPILRKVEVDHEIERDRDVMRTEKRKRRRRDVDGASVSEQYAGEWEWNLRTDELRRVDGEPQPVQRPRRVFPHIEKAKTVFRLIGQDPQFAEWKEKMMKIVLANQPSVWKEQRYRSLLKQFLRANGDPTQAPDRRIMVGVR